MAVTGSIDFKARKKAAWISFFTAFTVLSLKVYAFMQTNSTAILSDALESVVNVITAVVAVYVISYSAQPADDDHPYGHGKAEFFSAALEGSLIFAAAAMILVETYKSFSDPGHLRQITVGAIYVILATLINFGVGTYLARIGDREKSETLVASGKHLLSDVKTTVAVVVGLALVKLTGYEILDSLLAGFVGLHLMYDGFTIVRRSFKGLIDSIDPESLTMLSESIREFRQPGIINIHNLRILRSGSFHHIDAHLVVPEYWDVAKAHALSHDFEHNVVNKYPFDGEFAFHLDPCQRAYCKQCDVFDCPIRGAEFEKLYSFSTEDLIKGPQKTNDSYGTADKGSPSKI
jgi:cation diffusion facilitator family transporter